MEEVIEKIFDYGWDSTAHGNYEIHKAKAVELFSAEIRVLILESQAKEIDKIFELLKKMI
jgi:hypothetical protein